MMKLTVKQGDIRVADPNCMGRFVNAEQIKHYHSTLLEELGFKKECEPLIWVHSSTMPFKASSLCVVWEDSPATLSIQRGSFAKRLNIEGEYDLHEFVSDFLQTVREVWVGGER